DQDATIARIARGLLADLDLSAGVRLLGVGVSGLADWVQEDLFGDSPSEEGDEAPLPEPPRRAWSPGMDVVHADLGPGWVWGSGAGVVTVRFESAGTPPGPVRSFSTSDPKLERVLPPQE